MSRPSHPAKSTRGRAARRRAGIALLDVLVASTVLVIAILGHVSSVLWQHKMNRVTEDYSVAATTLGRFVERLRADPDWATLYARLSPLSQESVGSAALSSLAVDPSLACYPATTYYSDFTVPSVLSNAKFLVQVPWTVASGTGALRENTVAPRYGLPYDLNGDGVLDGNARNDDYARLPVVVRIRWQSALQGAKEIVISTWLRGER